MPDPSEHYQHQLLVDALASLPDLEELELPVSGVLTRLGCLAAPCRNLRRLSVAYQPTCDLDNVMVRGISGLTQLKELGVPAVDPARTCEMLLSNLPASLHVLRLEDICNGLTQPIFWFEDGHVVEVSIDVCTARDFVHYMGDMLVRGGRYGDGAGGGRAVVGLPRLRRVKLECASFGYMHGALEPGETEAERASQLLRRCPAVEVDCVLVAPDTPSHIVLRFMDVLGGALPRRMVLRMKACSSLRMQLRPVATKGTMLEPAPTMRPKLQDPRSLQPPALAEDAAVGAGHLSPVPRPKPCSLAGPALDRLAPLKAQAAHGGCSGSPRLGESDSCMVLLQGPVIATLAWAPQALSAWVDRLKKDAVAASASAGVEAPITLECFTLPGAHAVLVWSNKQAAVEAVEAVARAAAACTQAAAGGGGGAAQHLIMRRVATGRSWRGLSASGALSMALQQAAQDVYDGRLHTCFAGRSQLQRLQWVLEEWERLQVLHMP